MSEDVQRGALELSALTPMYKMKVEGIERCGGVGINEIGNYDFACT